MDSVSTVEINGEGRDHYFFTWGRKGDIIEHWIEGIGSNYGILQSGGWEVVGWNTWFLCKSEDGELIYMNPNFGSCNFVGTEIEEVHNSGIMFYPNPASDKIIIKNTESIKISAISFIDPGGQILLNISQGVDEIDISAFPSGLYFLRFIHEFGVDTRKILIQ